VPTSSFEKRLQRKGNDENRRLVKKQVDCPHCAHQQFRKETAKEWQLEN